MSLPLNASPSAPPSAPRGFALIITIVLVAFLVLILVGLATFTRVETQVADNSQQIAKARQNALMALNLALGQLQKHTGPDQRVTATADIVPPAGHSWNTVTYNATASTISFPTAADYKSARDADSASIESRWQDRHNRRWTGAWLNANAAAYDSTYDPDAPIDSTPSPALQSWLVSGNENAPTGDAFKPTDLVTGLTTSSSPFDSILDANGRTHRLLVKETANATADLARAVTAPEVAITADDVPGFTGPQTVGHYAWWVGDEGVKARANLSDAHAPDSLSDNEAKITRFQSAQRPAIEAVHATLSLLDPTASDDDADDLRDFQTTLGKVLTPAQFSYLPGAATPFTAGLQTRYHDLGIYSRGVLSDTRRGGLKADLTYLFGLTSVDDFRDALTASHGSNALAPANGANGSPLLNVAGTPFATLPTATPSGGGDYSTANIFRNSASWEQLWSFANQGATFNASDEATPRRHTAIQHGLYPLVIQSKMFFRLRLDGGSAGGDGVNRTGTLSIDSIPVVLLANPYSVPLGPQEYLLRLSGANPQLVYGITDNTTAPATDFATRAYPPASNGNSTEPIYPGAITYVLSSDGMAAGEAQIFTISRSPSDNPSIDGDHRIEVASSNDTKRVIMRNEFDPVPALTFNTPHKISASITLPDPNDTNDPPAQIPVTRAALRLTNSGFNSLLYLDSVSGLNLIHQVSSQAVSDSTFIGNFTLVVDPMADGVRQGGGVIAVLTQPPTTDSPAPRKPQVAGVYFNQQQAPFLQANYRTQRVTFVGNSNHAHPLEWSRRFTKNGSTGSATDSPNPWLAANLIRPSGSAKIARWGIVTIGEGTEQTLPPASLTGDSTGNVGYRNFLYDVPRPGHGLSSLGQLQHFNTAGFINAAGNGDIHTWQTNYPISNSYPQPRVPRDRLFYKYENTSGSVRVSTGYHYDGSYMWNDLLWDRFTFSTYPQTGDHDFDPGATDYKPLVNARLRPFRDRLTTAWNIEENFRGDGDKDTASNSRKAASNLLVEGAFNINSTSVDAWKALFASLRRIPVGGESAPNAPFARTLTPLGDADNVEKGISPNSWNGLRDLDDTQLVALAEEMVMQIRKRGPFLSLADFVNRRLSPASSDTLGLSASETGPDPLGLGLSGALQAALDHTINRREQLDPKFQTTSSTRVDNNGGHTTIAEPAYILPSALAGHPGHLLQADLLSALGPALSARSDTFTIRTYGDSVNPATGDVTGRAWCEAVVQRLPDYVRPETVSGGNASTDITGLHADNLKFGRRYQIISFRWLGPEDI